jgi:hypothetical protein
MSHPITTVLGKYKGGPSNSIVRVIYDEKAGGVVKAEYAGKSGGKAGFEGKMVEKGKKVLGFWFDYDQKITPGNRFVCTCVITLDGPNTLKAQLKTKDGGTDEWEAKRWSELDVPRAEGKISSFVIKDPAIFARVTDNGKGKRETWVEGARAKALEQSMAVGPHRNNFDGAITYIPGPATGDEYMTMHDVERKAHKEEEGHRDVRIAMLEGKVAQLEAAAAKGEDVKEKLEKAKALLTGEQAEKKMLEERKDKKWKNGAGSFTPASSKHAEHMPDEYATEYEVMRRLHKEDLERPAKERLRYEKELAKVQEVLGKGEGNIDNLKRHEDFLKKMLAAKLPNKEDFKEFKPSSSHVVLASRCVAVLGLAGVWDSFCCR